MHTEDLPDDRYISGVYNYCDRWCERCPFNDRCRVYAVEREMEVVRLLGDDSPEAFKAVFDQVMGFDDDGPDLGEEIVEEPEDLDLRELLPATVRPNPREDPLFQRADRWGDDLEAFLSIVDPDPLPFGAMPPESPGARTESVAQQSRSVPARPAEVCDALELLHRYRFFVVIKLQRALWSVGESLYAPGPESARIESDDGRGTAKLLSESFARAADALRTVAEFHSPWSARALSLSKEAGAIRSALADRFPGYESFRRPGFDDEPGVERYFG